MLSIDVTDKQLKLVRGSLAGNKIKINQVETRDVPADAIVNGYVTDISPVAEVIKNMIREKKITDKELIVCINSSSILYKELELIKPKSLKAVAAIEAMIISQMGLSSDYNVSYSIVGDGNADKDGNPTMKVMATACPQRMVDGYQSLFTQADLKIKQINISNNCITRLILNTPKLKDSMPFLCIQVDTDFININLYEEGQVSLSRYVKIDPADYEDNPDYVNIAVFDNLFRMIQFIGQRQGAKPLRQILFYGFIKDFVALSNSISSFDVPARVLSIPNNIQKFCEVDFSRYANAIGAFYKTDPVNEHVNLLDSTSVKSKASTSTFPIKVLGAAALGAVVVVGAYVVVAGINAGYKSSATKIDDKIVAGQFDEKRKEMELMQAVNTRFNNYKYNVKIANILFDYQPRGNLPQIMERLVEAEKRVTEVYGDNKSSYYTDGILYAYSGIEWNGYDVTLTVYCDKESYPKAYMKSLEDLDFFENLRYEGFKSINKTLVNAEVRDELPDDVEQVFEFRFTVGIKGGHSINANGSKYVYVPTD